MLFLDEKMVTNKEVPEWKTNNKQWPSNMPELNIESAQAYTILEKENGKIKAYVTLWEPSRRFEAVGEDEATFLGSYYEEVRTVFPKEYLVLLRMDVTSPKVVDIRYVPEETIVEVSKDDTTGWAITTERIYVLFQQSSKKAFKNAIHQLRWTCLLANMGALPAAKL